MAMDANALADALRSGLGKPPPTSDETKGLARAIIAEMQQAVVSHPVGMVTGIAPPSGGPLVNGAASNGLIVGMTPPTLAAKMQSEMGKPMITPELLGMATAIVTHFLTGLVSFGNGKITGICTNTPVNPGSLTGEGMQGQITGLSGSVLAPLMATSMGKPGPSPELTGLCTELCNYVQNNAEVTYLTGSITGTCSAGGGPISAGTGVGGTIS